MSNVVPFTRFLQDQAPADLSNTDIEEILRRVRTLPGEWSARFIRVEKKELWAYVYYFGSSKDCTPVFSITRRANTYTAVSWHLIDFVVNGGFSEHTGTLDSILRFIEMLAEEAGAN